MHAKHPRGISHPEVRRSLAYACQTSAWDFPYGSSSEFDICMPNIRVGFHIRKFVGVWHMHAKHPRGISHTEVRRSLANPRQTSAWDFTSGSSSEFGICMPNIRVGFPIRQFAAIGPDPARPCRERTAEEKKKGEGGEAFTLSFWTRYQEATDSSSSSPTRRRGNSRSHRHRPPRTRAWCDSRSR